MAASAASSSSSSSSSLKESGNALFKSGNYLKAAAIYTQAIKADPSNATLFSNRSAAFLHLLKVTKALADAETTIKLNPAWEKGYFRKGSALEATERYEEALVAYREALEHNPQSTEVSKKIKKLSQVIRDKHRSQEKQAAKADHLDFGKLLEQLKSDLTMKIKSESLGSSVCKFTQEVIESAMKDWSEKNGKLDARVFFHCDPKPDNSEQPMPIVVVDKAFESPDTLQNCVSFLRQHAIESVANAACLVVPKKSISFPQVWKGQGTRKWRHSQSDGFFVQLELSSCRKLWFFSSTQEKGGQLLCRDVEQVDINSHAVLPPLFR